nr:MAG TPA: hypothetical protein [Caudoviricetes sp.]
MQNDTVESRNTSKSHRNYKKTLWSRIFFVCPRS